MFCMLHPSNNSLFKTYSRNIRTRHCIPNATFPNSKTNQINNKRHIKITYDNFKKVAHDDNGYPGTTDMTISWNRNGDHTKADEFLAMCKDILRHKQKFENLCSVSLVCPDTPLDGRFIEMISYYKPFVKDVCLSCWTFHKPTKNMWINKQKLETLTFEYTDGLHILDAPILLLNGCASVTNVHIINLSPFYPELIDTRHITCDTLYISGFTISKEKMINETKITYQNCKHI